MQTNAWPRETISSLISSGAITAHKDGNYGSLYPRVEEFGDDGVPFLTAKSINSGRIDIDGAPRLSKARADSLPFGAVLPDDVLLSHNATIGRVAVVPQYDGRMLVGTSLTYFRLNQQKLRPRYFAAFLAGADFQNQLVAVMSHSTRNQVPITAQRSLSVLVPPLEVQDMVASTVGQLDDKIEQNRRTGAKLEELARAVFKAWFVDFEPVKAKAAGATAFPGMPPETFAALPTSFEDSELGPVPRGWETTRWGEIASLEYGKSLKGYQNGEGSVQVFGTNGPIGWHTAKLADGPGIVIGRKGAYRGVHFSPEPFWAIDTAFYLNPKKLFSWRWAYYELLRVDINSIDSGSAIPSTSREDFYSLPVCLARQSMFHGFDDVLAPVFEMLVAMKAESDKLAALRDYLLPLLLSGRVRVIDQQT